MQTTLEHTDKHTVKLTIEVPPDEFSKDLDRAYRKIARQVKIPGFRKGKVPKQVIDAQLGRETVLGEFLEDSVPSYYREAVREHDLAPIADPDIELGVTLIFGQGPGLHPLFEIVAVDERCRHRVLDRIGGIPPLHQTAVGRSGRAGPIG